jgi:hypothetical protein
MAMVGQRSPRGEEGIREAAGESRCESAAKGCGRHQGTRRGRDEPRVGEPVHFENRFRCAVHFDSQLTLFYPLA